MPRTSLDAVAMLMPHVRPEYREQFVQEVLKVYRRKLREQQPGLTPIEVDTNTGHWFEAVLQRLKEIEASGGHVDGTA